MRPSQGLIGRWATFFAVVVFAFFAGRDALVFAASATAPELAFSLSPANARASSAVFDRQLMKGSVEAREFPKWRGIARAGLNATPLNASALRIMAFTSPEGARQRELMLLSEKVSRRDLLTQLWLIEDSVQRNDLAGAISHYDRALSTSPASRENLFKILAEALELPEIRQELAPYIKGDRPWAYDFLGYAVDNAPSPAMAADLLLRSGGSRTVPKQRPVETMMLERLIAAGQGKVARQYAGTMTTKGKDVFDNFPIGPDTLDPELRPFTWSLSADARVATSIEPGGRLGITVPPSVRGQAANRVMVLRPGKWALAQTVEFPSLSPMAAATWIVSCSRADKSVTTVLTQRLEVQPGRHTYRSEFVVPSDCLAVKFELYAQGEDSQVEAGVTVSGLRLFAV